MSKPKQKRLSQKKPKVVTAVPVQLDPNQRYSLAEANQILRQSPAKTFNDIRADRLKVIRDGARTYVPGSELIRLSTLPQQQPAT